MASIPITGVRLRTLGDFDSDGNSDFVWTDRGESLGAWEYDPVGQTVSSTFLTPPSSFADWTIYGSAHFSNANGSNLAFDQMLMKAPNGVMTLQWLSGSVYTGINIIGAAQDNSAHSNPPALWQNINYISAGQFTNNGAVNFLVSDANNHLLDWYIDSTYRLQGADLTATSGHTRANKAFVGAGNFIDNGVTNFLVHNTPDGHLYHWFITPENKLGGVDLTATSGQNWVNKQLIAIGNFDDRAPVGHNEWLVRVNDPTSPLHNHILEWWITDKNQLTGIDLSAPANPSLPKTLWSDNYELLTVGSFDNNANGEVQLLVRNLIDQHLLEWWITPDGAITGIDLTQNSGNIIPTNVQFLDNRHYNDANGSTHLDELLMRNTEDGNFYEWWTATGLDGKTIITGVPLADPPASAGFDWLVV
jgi:hypothetical protein